jgi:hypothetical protein
MKNHYQWALCESCIQRHCNRRPKHNPVKHDFVCIKYRKHQEGFKMEEVYHEKPKQYV